MATATAPALRVPVKTTELAEAGTFILRVLSTSQLSDEEERTLEVASDLLFELTSRPEAVRG